MFYFVFLIYNFVIKGFVFVSVFDDILCVVYVVKCVLILFMIYKYFVFFVWVECSVGIFCCCLVIFGINKGELNRLMIRNEKYLDDCVV